MEIGFFCELGCVSFLKKYSGSIRKQCHDPNYSNKVLSFFLRVFIESNELILLYILQTVCHSQGSRLGKHRCRFKNCGWCGMQMGDCSSLPLTVTEQSMNVTASQGKTSRASGQRKTTKIVLMYFLPSFWSSFAVCSRTNLPAAVFPWWNVEDVVFHLEKMLWNQRTWKNVEFILEIKGELLCPGKIQ